MLRSPTDEEEQVLLEDTYERMVRCVFFVDADSRVNEDTDQTSYGPSFTYRKNVYILPVYSAWSSRLPPKE